MVNPHAPQADFEITTQLVTNLLQEQLPAYATLPVAQIDEGWDNVTFKLGEDYAVRMPRRREAVQLLLNEQAWLPEITVADGIGYPCPVETGQPSAQYPCPWSILPWFTGQPCEVDCLHAGEAQRLAQCLALVHQPAPAAAPLNEVRGVPLARRAESVDERLARLRERADWWGGNIDHWWAEAQAAPSSRACRWLHGDLHPLNILHTNGAITALIDWGDITSGDVATDLAAFWMLFDAPAVRTAALRQYGADSATIARSRGWAILFGAVLAESGLRGDPRHAAIGTATLRRVAEEAVA